MLQFKEFCLVNFDAMWTTYYSKKWKILQGKYQWLRDYLYFKFNAFRFGMELRVIQDNLSKIENGDIVLFACCRNEASRLRYFMQYYERLGVEHFIFVDNGSTDDSHLFWKERPNVSVFETSGSYKASNFGMHWLNHLLSRYGTGHWCIVCDPDELLVFPGSEVCSLQDLSVLLEAQGREAFFAVMLDFYPPHELGWESGCEDWLEICPYFDGGGYWKVKSSPYSNLFVRGGVRARLMDPKDRHKAPALNKYPFVKWKRSFFYIQSMHMLRPIKLNKGYAPTDITGALLHFKFMPVIISKIEQELVEKQHYDNSREYLHYKSMIEKHKSFYDEKLSVRYSDSTQLLRMGLIQLGEDDFR
jgi:hypothetical protein